MKKTMLLLLLVVCLPGVVSVPVYCTSPGLVCQSDNLLGSQPGVPGEAECGQLCEDTQHCKFYSYFDGESFPVRSVCLMFSSCGRVSECIVGGVASIVGSGMAAQFSHISPGLTPCYQGCASCCPDRRSLTTRVITASRGPSTARETSPRCAPSLRAGGGETTSPPSC